LERPVSIVPDSEDQRVEVSEGFERAQLDPICFTDELRIGERIVNQRLDPELSQLAIGVDDLGIADVRNILLEGEAKDADPRIDDPAPAAAISFTTFCAR
jgi:hypothetical protein